MNDDRIDPADVRAHLTRQAQPAATFAVAATVAMAAVVPPLPATERDAILASISSSYFRLRRGLAVVTLAFPLVLWLGAGPHDLQVSISAYYHFARDRNGYGDGTMRDVFVGVLWTIGSFLFFYRGYSRAEDRALNVAGVAAIIVSLCPEDWPAGSTATPTGHIHAAAAVVFFLAIAYVSLFRAGDTAQLLPDPAKRSFMRLYRLLGGLMVAIPSTVVAVHTVVRPGAHNIMLWLIEVSGMYVFAVFWLVKSREIALIESTSAT